MVELLRANVRSEQNRNGFLPRKLDYYLNKGSPNIKRVQCVLGELTRVFDVHKKEMKDLLSKKHNREFEKNTETVSREVD